MVPRGPYLTNLPGIPTSRSHSPSGFSDPSWLYSFFAGYLTSIPTHPTPKPCLENNVKDEREMAPRPPPIRIGRGLEGHLLSLPVQQKTLRAHRLWEPPYLHRMILSLGEHLVHLHRRILGLWERLDHLVRHRECQLTVWLWFLGDV